MAIDCLRDVKDGQAEGTPTRQDDRTTLRDNVNDGHMQYIGKQIGEIGRDMECLAAGRVYGEAAYQGAGQEIHPDVRALSGMHHPETVPTAASGAGDVIESRKVLVAIPAGDAEVTIGSTVLRARKHADHVIVIDYGSTDNTAEIAMLAGATVIAGRRKDENGRGIRDAFTFARRAGADVLVFLDEATLGRMEEIPWQIRPILENKADFINGMRPAETKGTGNRKPHYLRRARDALAFATHPAGRRKAGMTQNGFRAFSRKMFDCYTFSQAGMAGDTEAPGMAEAKTKRKQARICGGSGLDGTVPGPFPAGTRKFDDPAERRARKNPSRLLSVLGAVMILLGAVCIFMVMKHFNATHDLGVEYGIGSMVFTFPGLLLVYNGMLQRSGSGAGKGKRPS